MKPRSWDVGRTVVLTVMAAIALSACGQARLASRPEPEFTSGQRAEPTVVAAPEGGGTEGVEILPSDVEPDADDLSVDVEQMLLIDDAGVIAPNASGWSEFDSYLDGRLIPADLSASVAVMIDGQLVHEAAFGERVAGSGDRTETNDRFRIASISKTVTAIVTMQLVEDGTLTLDDPIGEVLIQHLGLVSHDADAPSLTVRKLLSHTSGFPQSENTFFSNGAVSCTDAAMQGLSSGISSGGGFRYSNMNFCVLGILLEAVTGKTYERVIDEHLLTPLGIDGMRMTSTYELGPDEVSHQPTPGRNFMETLGAAGAWNATPADLVAILNSIDPTTPGWKAVSPETARSMRYRVPVGTPPGGYGLGLINYDNGYGHTGTIQNTHAMVLVQDDGVTWALTVSGNYPSDTPQLKSIMRSAFSAAFGK